MDSPKLSQVTSMSQIFSHAPYFNSDLINLDVSSVTDMSFMFSAARLFNGDLSDWNVSSVASQILK